MIVTVGLSETKDYQPAPLYSGESSYIARAVRWFRAEDLRVEDQNIRKVGAIALAFLLSITFVGIYFVVLGALEWSRQSKKPIPVKTEPKTEDLPQESKDDFPLPFETLKRLNLYPDDNIEGIKIKVNRALKQGNGYMIPRGYRTLKKDISSKERVEELYDEAKILSYHITMKQFADLNIKDPALKVYKPGLIANLDMVLNELVKTKKFPADPFSWY